MVISWKDEKLMWLLVPRHHLCGYLACYGVIRWGWEFNGKFTINRETLLPSYFNHWAPLSAA